MNKKKDSKSSSKEKLRETQKKSQALPLINLDACKEQDEQPKISLPPELGQTGIKLPESFSSYDTRINDNESLDKNKEASAQDATLTEKVKKERSGGLKQGEGVGEKSPTLLHPSLEQPGRSIPELPPLNKRKAFGRYQILSMLGKGAMATVYKIYHPELDMLYALKILREGSMDDETLKRFKREAQVVAKLKHPNIVSVHDMGVEKGKWYIVMDLVDGESLDKILAKKTLDIPGYLEILKSLAKAVDYAHQMGVIHRDIKPSNVMIEKSGRPLLMDFGIARPVEVAGDLTRKGQIMGTPSYMSPEQAQGQIDKLDARTDVYSLGAVLYEMLTGSLPVEGASLSTLLFNILRRKPVPPREINPSIPQEVEEICLKALEKLPADRFQTAGEMAMAIDHYLREGGTEKEPAPPSPTVVKLEEKEEGEKRIGKYRLIKEIAKGGMGIIYLAEDAELKRKVAIKYLIAGKLASEDDEKRFLREAQMAARLSHTNIVQVYDIGRYEDGLYFTMEYFEGRDLSRLIKEEGAKIRRDFTRIVKIVISILDGLAYAHGLSVIHRDIKPANILIRDDEVKITDFGLARDIDQEHFTQSGLFLGTPVYTPPEQIVGDVVRVNQLSDIYSMGVILYEMMTGEVPFQGKTFADLSKKVESEEPFSPRTFNKNIPIDLETICLKAIEKKQEHRYPSAKAFRDDLNRFLQGEPILAAPPTIGRKFIKAFRRHRKLGVSLGVLILVFITVYLSLSYSQKKEMARQRTQLNQWVSQIDKDIKDGHIEEARALLKEVLKQDKQKGEKLTVLIQEKEKQLAQEEDLKKKKNIEVNLSEAESITTELSKKADFFHPDDKISRLDKANEFLFKAKNLADDLSRRGISSDELKDHRMRMNKIEKMIEGLKSGKTVSFQFKNIEGKDISSSGVWLTLWEIPSKTKLDNNNSYYNNLVEKFDIPMKINQWYAYLCTKEGYAPTRDMFFIDRNLIKNNTHVEEVILMESRNVPDGMVFIQGGKKLTLGKGILGGKGRLVPQKVCDISPFLIDQYEVTNKEYREFWKEQRDNEELIPCNWKNKEIPDGQEMYPVALTHEMAKRYAKWAGKRLPTIYEWDLAARGKDQREYPWGNSIDEKTVYSRSASKGSVEVGITKMDVSPYDVYDMAGNMMEWTIEDNPKEIYWTRGGGWNSEKKDASAVQAKQLTSNPLDDKTFSQDFIYRGVVGLRCVKNIVK